MDQRMTNEINTNNNQPVFLENTSSPRPLQSLAKTVQNIEASVVGSYDSMVYVTQVFLEACGPLNHADTAAAASLLRIAQELDTNFTPALMGQWGLTFRDLKKSLAVGDDQGDELARLLKR
jgi:hypothetical protein